MKLYEKLQQYAQSNYYPFHMPGHKRNTEMLPKWNPYGMDITEIDGFDNLHDANDILAQTMKEIAAFRKAEESFLLINGTTCGLLAGISSCVKRGDEIIVARNCHKAVYHGIVLNGLTPHYIYPQIHQGFGVNGGISPKRIKKMLITYPDSKLVVLTSPTYEGVVSDIAEIAKIVHSFGIPLLVDQAHGAHFGMQEEFPQSALSYGADIVVESVHKTLPAFTQTALLHVQGNLVDKKKIKKYLGIYETSSPSYPMMAGIEWCEDFCKREKNGAFLKYAKDLKRVREEIGKLEFIQLLSLDDVKKELSGFDYDKGKLVFGVKNQIMTGQELYEILLNRYHLQMEMASMGYVIAMTSVMDREEGLERLLQALTEINENLRQQNLKIHEENDKEHSSCKKSQKEEIKTGDRFQNKMVYTPYEAENMEQEIILFCESEGRIAADYVYLYPPGIPLLVPGEQIDEKLIDFVKECRQQGLNVKGVTEEKIAVIAF